MSILAHPKSRQKNFEKDSAAGALAGIWDDPVSFWKRRSCRRPSGHSIRRAAVLEREAAGHVNPIASFDTHLKASDRLENRPTDFENNPRWSVQLIELP
jgi:hypothetical protein